MSLVGQAVLGLPSRAEFLGSSLDSFPAAPGGIAPGAAARPTAPLSALYAFGDSLSDAGNAYIRSGGTTPVSPPYSDGRYSNGPVWVQDLSGSLGLGPLAPDLAASNLPNRTDFAVGGAQTGGTPLHAQNATDLPAQLTRFEQEVPAPQPDALYTISVGSNDLLAAITAFPSSPLEAFTDLGSAAANVNSFVAGLASRGAQNLLVLTVPDLGKTPAATAQGPTVAFTASALSATFDQMLTTSLQSLAAVDHLKLDFIDGYGLLDSAVANPAAFGLTNVTDPVWTGNSSDPASGVLRATTPAAQNQFLFWDSVHPTASVHATLGATAYQSLLPTA